MALRPVVRHAVVSPGVRDLGVFGDDEVLSVTVGDVAGVDLPRVGNACDLSLFVDFDGDIGEIILSVFDGRSILVRVGVFDSDVCLVSVHVGVEDPVEVGANHRVAPRDTDPARASVGEGEFDSDSVSAVLEEVEGEVSSFFGLGRVEDERVVTLAFSLVHSCVFPDSRTVYKIGVNISIGRRAVRLDGHHFVCLALGVIFFRVGVRVIGVGKSDLFVEGDHEVIGSAMFSVTGVE